MVEQTMVEQTMVEHLTPLGARGESREADVVTGLDVDAADVAEALRVDADEWRAELPQIDEWFDFIGEKLPTSLRDEFESLKQRLADAD